MSLSQTETKLNEMPRAARLKSATESTHDQLDRRIMSANPFASRERYATFLHVQHAFHGEIDALYDDATLRALIPDLEGRRRLSQVAQDLADLGQVPIKSDYEPAFQASQSANVPQALGWLYVAEGSNLGAAFLLKAAQRMGLSETNGARHLAGAPEGRANHWRQFQAALNGAELSEADEEAMIAGAKAAFARVQGLVERHMPLEQTQPAAAAAG